MPAIAIKGVRGFIKEGCGSLAPYFDGFAAAAGSIGYTHASLRDLLVGAKQFGRFLAAGGLVDLRHLRDRHLDEFLSLQPMRQRGKYLLRMSRGSRAAPAVLRYLRHLGVVPAEPVPPAQIHEALLKEWLDFLKEHQGLADGSIALYRRHVARFLVSLGSDATPARLHVLTSARTREYVIAHASGMGRSGRKALVSTLRVFLRFARAQGYLTSALDGTIQRVPSFKHEHLPRGPRWEDVLRLPAAVDRRTTHGRRDFAILLILITYGVRAGQVAGLRLDDLDWRGCSITFEAAKGGKRVHVPLMSEVGDAIVDYLRERRTVRCRQLFLSTDPPFGPLAPSSIGSVVCRAFRVAGVHSPHRGSHAIRHAWATRALAQGQSLKIIADLIGHRSIEMTRIYAKVDQARLREVALSWPQEGWQ